MKKGCIVVFSRGQSSAFATVQCASWHVPLAVGPTKKYSQESLECHIYRLCLCMKNVD